MSINYLRLSSRVEAVAARLETAIRIKGVTQSMAHIVSAMDNSMQQMNLEKMTQVMDQFERQFEDLDIQSDYVENAMNNTTSLTTPQEEVDNLIAMTADEHHIDLKEKFSELPSNIKTKDEMENKNQEELLKDDGEDELMKRFSKLKS